MSSIAVGAGGEAPDTQLERLEQACDSELEKKFLALLVQHGYRLPDNAQQIVTGFYVRPDFAYHVDGMDVAVFIDGPIHESDHQHHKDLDAQTKLEDELGWLVLRFTHSDADEGWLATIATHGDVFGSGKSGA